MPESSEELSGNATRSNSSLWKKKPDFFIVGAPKCGTTALAEYLGRHPDIYMPRKEMHFFGSDLKFGRNFYRRDVETYLTEFNQWNGQARVGEASVWYLFSERAAAEIKEFNPEASIIILLRDPVSMLYSLYYQFLFDGNECLPTFEEALAAEADRREGRRIGRLTYLVQALDYRSTVSFSGQVRRYFDLFGRERVHVIIYDDLAANTANAYAETLDFLGVASDSVDSPVGEATGSMTVVSPFLRAILNDPIVRGAAIGLRRCVPRPIFTAIKATGLQICALNVRPIKRPSMLADTRLALQREFAPEVERLSSLLGRDLTHWSKSECAPAQSLAASQSRLD
ncbi:MAG TPA: sulfotransferase [Candidatus Sulfotelmatobacter sp.]|nr:sulfotransferase [Candidatus Sulfotelmatobacter sp.]